MGDNKNFTIVATIEKKEEKEGSKGTYFLCKTDKGSVSVGQDLIDEVIAGGGTAPKIGGTYTFEGVEYPPKDPKFKTGMRFCNSYEPANKNQGSGTEKPKETHNEPLEAHHVHANAMNGPDLGNRRSCSVELVCSQIGAGKLIATDENIKEALDKWDKCFLDYAKTGSYTVPF